MTPRRRALIDRLRDEDPAVRAKAAEALDRLEVLEGLPDLVGRLRGPRKVDWLAALRSLLGRRDEISLKFGVRCLGHPDGEVRVAALDLVESFSDARAAPPVCGCLADREPVVRARAAEVLGRLGDRRKGEALLPLLSDADPRVVARAAESVGLLDHWAAEPLLLPLLESSDPDVRGAAAEALGRMGLSPSA